MFLWIFIHKRCRTNFAIDGEKNGYLNKERGFSEVFQGSYLIRFSNSERGGFTISYLSEKLTAQHIRISRSSDGGFRNGNTKYNTLEEVLKAGKKLYGLKVVCRVRVGC